MLKEDDFRESARKSTANVLLHLTYGVMAVLRMDMSIRMQW